MSLINWDQASRQFGVDLKSQMSFYTQNLLKAAKQGAMELLNKKYQNMFHVLTDITCTSMHNEAEQLMRMSKSLYDYMTQYRKQDTTEIEMMPSFRVEQEIQTIEAYIAILQHIELLMIEYNVHFQITNGQDTPVKYLEFESTLLHGTLVQNLIEMANSTCCAKCRSSCALI